MRFEQQISACLTKGAAVAAVLAMFASGRGVSASEQTPQTPASPSTVSRPQDPAAQTGAVTRISADDAVRMALENNLGIQAQRLGPEIGTFEVAQARAAYAPALFSTTQTRSATSPPDFLASGGVSETTTSDRLQTNLGLQQNVPWGGGRYTVSLDASRLETSSVSSFNPQLGSNLSAQFVQPLLRNFKIDGFRQQLLVSRKNLEIADVQLQERITITSRAVRSSYFDLVGAIEGLRVAQQSLDLARTLLQNNRRRVEVGTLAPIDITEAEAEVASNEEGVIQAEARIRTAEDRLRALIMNPAQADFWTVRIEPAEAPSLQAVDVDIEAAVKNALENRTDILQARKRLETTDINLQYFRNQQLPAVDLTANYNTVGVGGTQYQFGPGFPPIIEGQTQRSFKDALSDVFGNQFKTWSVQLNVSYPLGQSQAEAAAAGARLQRRQEQTSIRDLELNVATTVRDVGRQVNTNLKRVEATRKARQFAERRLEAEQKRMEVGLSTTFQLFQAQRDLARQRQNELNAIIDYNRSLVDFEAIQKAPVR
jgi:outer membrane protein TolC